MDANTEFTRAAVPPWSTSSAAPLEAAFDTRTQFARTIVAVARLDVPLTATAPPQDASFEDIVQSVAVTVESSCVLTAPPHVAAEFEDIVQCIAVTVESPPAKTAPPHPAEFKDIVQSVAVTVESSAAETAPPPQAAEFEDIVQFAAATSEPPA